MFESCHSPGEVALVYAQRFGVPVRLFDRRLFFLTSLTLGAVAMPQQLGQRVRKTVGDQFPLPIIRHSERGGQWLFVVGPNRGHLRNRALPALARHDARMLASGVRVWLPMSDYSVGWHWHSPLLAGEDAIPPRTRVLHAALDVIEGGGC
ncbi:hypothetical protein [Nocardia nepalensis]|uniref:hypothetical protein n=1 Tax=Nocardia nepalensis TaxID=3375448 RepID=UPI003B67284C